MVFSSQVPNCCLWDWPCPIHEVPISASLKTPVVDGLDRWASEVSARVSLAHDRIIIRSVVDSISEILVSGSGSCQPVDKT